MHTSNDKQHKFFLLCRLYRFDMSPNDSFFDHERTFDDFVQSLSAISKMIDSEKLIMLYTNSLPIEIFSNWIQSQMAFIDNLSITEFKNPAYEEALHLNIAGVGQSFRVKRDPNC